MLGVSPAGAWAVPQATQGGPLGLCQRPATGQIPKGIKDSGAVLAAVGSALQSPTH